MDREAHCQSTEPRSVTLEDQLSWDYPSDVTPTMSNLECWTWKDSEPSEWREAVEGRMLNREVAKRLEAKIRTDMMLGLMKSEQEKPVLFSDGPRRT